MSERSFYFGLDLSSSLTVAEIWPDGDAPENPTAEDVIARVQMYGSVDTFLHEWNMTYGARLTIDGQDAGLRG